MRVQSAAAWKHVTTIIIVEDDSSVNLAVSRLLEAAGFDVRSFMSAGALLADAHACDADCLVLDVHLPDMNGFDLQRKLVATGFTAPVVVITAHDDAMHRRAARDIGAFAYLTKPFSSLSLVDAVSRAAAADR
jgi:FixJ family two-component response regulator